ncbi:hypothetical protein Avbf_03726 [Armadillidium vulgare]|nr:hypothetical protein Avbf_03726 [Armadillidium vulgare]
MAVEVNFATKSVFDTVGLFEKNTLESLVSLMSLWLRTDSQYRNLVMKINIKFKAVEHIYLFIRSNSYCRKH